MTEYLAVAVAVLFAGALGLQWQVTTLARAMNAWREGLEKERKAAVPTAGHPSSVESTHEGPRPTSAGGSGTPHPPQAQRLVSPTRAKLQMERKFAEKAQAVVVLRRAAEEAAK